METNAYVDRALNTVTPFSETFQPLLDAVCKQEEAMSKYANMCALNSIKDIAIVLNELKDLCASTTGISRSRPRVLFLTFLQKSLYR
jgi:hypothetical protein